MPARRSGCRTRCPRPTGAQRPSPLVCQPHALRSRRLPRRRAVSQRPMARRKPRGSRRRLRRRPPRSRRVQACPAIPPQRRRRSRPRRQSHRPRRQSRHRPRRQSRHRPRRQSRHRLRRRSRRHRRLRSHRHLLRQSRPRPRSWVHEGRALPAPANPVLGGPPRRPWRLVNSSDLYYNKLPRDRYWNSNPRPSRGVNESI
jgi:hypothetical protein